MPMVIAPTVMNEVGDGGLKTASILAMPYFVILPLLPFTDWFVLCMGEERTIFYTNIGYAIALGILAIGFNLNPNNIQF